MSKGQKNRGNKLSSDAPIPTPVVWTKACALANARPGAFALTVLFLCAFLFLSDLFFTGQIFLVRDGLIDLVPYRVFAANALASGQFPFWNPYSGAGKPYMADMMSGIFYPPNFLFSVFHPALALKIFWLFHLWLAGSAAYFLVRQFDIDSKLALAAGISFMLGAWVIVRLEFLNDLATAVWAPLVMGLFVRFCRRTETSAEPLRELWNSRALIAITALVLAVQYFANFAESLLYPLVGSLCLIVVMAAQHRKPALTAAQVLFWIVAGGLAVLITMPQLAPSLEFATRSERNAPMDPRFVGMASMSPLHFLDGLFPFIVGRPGYPNVFWGSTFEFWVGAFYPGALVILAAPYALLWWGKKSPSTNGPRLAALAGISMLVIGVVLACGDNTPVYGFLRDHVPLMNRFRFPSKILIVAAMGFVLLAGSGLAALSQLRAEKTVSPTARAIALAEGLLCLLAAVGIGAIIFDPSLLDCLFPRTDITVPLAQYQAVVSSLAWSLVFMLAAAGLLAWLALFPQRRECAIILALLPVFVLINLTLLGREIHPVGPDAIADAAPQTKQQPFAQDTTFRIYASDAQAQQYLYGNANPNNYEWAKNVGFGGMWLGYGLNSNWQAGPKLNSLGWWSATMGEHPGPVAAGMAELLGLRWIVGGAPWQDVLWNGKDATVTVAEMKTAKPRFWLATAWESAKDLDEVSERFELGKFDINHPIVEPAALVNGSVTQAPVPAPSPTTASATNVEVTSNTLNRIVLQAAPTAPALLMIDDDWFPGWRATVDGKEEPIHRADVMFRGIFLTPGTHTVRLDFFPNYFVIGCLASAVGLAATLFLLISGRATFRTKP